MKKNAVTTVVTYCILALAGVVSFVLPDELVLAPASAAGPTTIRLPGIVRDFKKTDPAITTAPVAGNGHYAGNLGLALGAENLPTYTGAGYKVAAQWRDKNGRAIAPHMYMFNYGAPGTIPVALASAVPPMGAFDTYNSNNGAYGGANVGAPPTYTTGAIMPAIVIPMSLRLAPNTGNMAINGPAMVSSNIHCNTLTINGNVTINGNISILCEGLLTLGNGATIALTAGSRLKIYMRAGGMSWNGVVIGDPLRPSRVTIYNFGTAQFGIHNHAKVYANFVSPNASLYIYNHAEFFGKYIGSKLEFNNHSGFHIDRAPGVDACDVLLADTAGAKGANSHSGIASAAAFNSWYRDVLGQNLSMVHPIELVDNGSGVYEYHSNAFCPIDNLLFGNEGQTHNFYFTYAFETRFTYNKCTGQYLEFQGADDAWMFVDGMLVMDRGGVIPGVAQTVDMDRLDLSNGKTYSVHFFYAQRNATLASFHLRTNIQLSGENVAYTMSGGVD